LQITKNGKKLIVLRSKSPGEIQEIQIYDIESGKRIQSKGLITHAMDFEVGISENLYILRQQNAVVLWDGEKNVTASNFSDVTLDTLAEAVQFLEPTSEVIAWERKDIRAWNLNSGKKTRNLLEKLPGILPYRITYLSELISLDRTNNMVSILNPKTLKVENQFSYADANKNLPNRTNYLNLAYPCILRDQDQFRVIAAYNAPAGPQRDCLIWQISTGKLLHQTALPRANSFPAGYTADGKIIIREYGPVMKKEGSTKISIFDPVTAKLVAEADIPFLFPSDQLTTSDQKYLKFNTNRNWFVQNSKDPDTRPLTIALYDVKTLKEHSSFTLEGTVEDYGAHALSPDNRLLAVVRKNGTVDFWDFAKKEFLGNLKEANQPASLFFHPDGQKLLASYFDGTLILWDVSEFSKKLSPKK
jgi:WD40 repeat protein